MLKTTNLILLISCFTTMYEQKGQIQEPFTHTFSIVAYDPVTRDMGIAVQSHWFSVGNTVSWGESGVGVIATQGMVNFNYGVMGLEMLKKGWLPSDIIDSLQKSDPGKPMRQVAILNNKGNVAARTGSICVEYAGHITGKYYAVQANFAEDEQVLKQMSKAFETTVGSLAEKMLAALEAAQSGGGDIRGKQSASLLVLKNQSTGRAWIDRKVDLTVQDHPDPIRELKRLYKVNLAYDAFNMGNHAIAQGKMEEADKYFARAQELYPENPEMTFWYAVDLINAGYKVKAKEVFMKIFEKHSHWQTEILPRVYKAGILSIDQGVYDEIIKM